MTLRQRQYVVRVQRYCTNCFARTHLVGVCISMDGCQVCGDLHHTMLHPESVLDRLSQPQQIQPLRQRRQQQQHLHQRRQQQQPQRQRRQQQQQPQRQRRQQQQQQPQRQRRQPRQQHQQQQHRQRRLQHQHRADATPNAQGLVQQIVSALDQLTGALNIAPVQGGRHVEDRSSNEGDNPLIDLD
ncbi:uncharacterized protein LOC135950548 [Calliphora vicina]|uniref:uncharacterized protein LOC135950548 n=1 Tax=Calliphora vicina TaxID=7373 RepID=UPI00325B0E5E